MEKGEASLMEDSRDEDVWELVKSIIQQLDQFSQGDEEIKKRAERLKKLHEMNLQVIQGESYIKLKTFGLALERRLYIDKLRAIEHYIHNNLSSNISPYNSSLKKPSKMNRDDSLLEKIEDILYKESDKFALIDRFSTESSKS